MSITLVVPKEVSTLVLLFVSLLCVKGNVAPPKLISWKVKEDRKALAGIQQVCLLPVECF